MKVKMLNLAAGPAGVMRPGEVHDLPEEQAQAFITGGYAEAVVSPIVDESAPAEEVIETADAPAEPVEKAVKPRAKKK